VKPFGQLAKQLRLAVPDPKLLLDAVVVYAQRNEAGLVDCSAQPEAPGQATATCSFAMSSTVKIYIFCIVRES
jgi:hypothetical protein